MKTKDNNNNKKSNSILTLAAPAMPRSLCWSGDNLIDWTRGGDNYSLEGLIQDSHRSYGFPFDAAVMSPCGNYAAVYQRQGTKGLLMRNGRILRELNRSCYHADAYEYPICFFTGPDGRTLLAHCPEEYTQIEIEDAESGRRMPTSRERAGTDVFHSRLRVSADGRWLLSAGWLWHPYGDVEIFDLHACLKNTSLFDQAERHVPLWGEPGTAEFLPDGRILISTYGEEWSDEEEEHRDDDGTVQMPSSSLGIFDPVAWRFERIVKVNDPVGNLMPLDDRHAIGFYEHPKLFSLETGDVVQSWPEIASGTQCGSILLGSRELPAIACDQVVRRFAVADEDKIHIVSDL